MSCAEFDLKDYFFGELPEPERASAERHVLGCAGCAAELEELQGMRAGLLMLREEEPPRRIGFVSDKVFEPSAARRWLGAFWMSGARLGFASAAMLSAALTIYAVRLPKTIETKVEVASAPRPEVDVKAAVASALTEQQKKTEAMLAAMELKHGMEERALAMRVSEYVTNVERRMGSERLVAYNAGSPEKGQ